MSTASVDWPAQEVGHRDPKRAALSGWIGSALEYYDFALYSLAAALVFPTVFFPSGNATLALIALARHLRRRVLHPTHRRGRAGRLGRPARPQERPGLRDVPDGHVDLPGRCAPHLRTGRRARADSAGRAPHGPGLRRGRRARRRQRHDRGALPGRPPRLLRELQPAGHPGRLDPGHRRTASPRRVPARPTRSRPGAGGSRSCSAPSSSWPATSSVAGCRSRRPSPRRRTPRPSASCRSSTCCARIRGEPSGAF